VRVAVGGFGRHADPPEHLVHDRLPVAPAAEPVDRETLGDQVADLHPGVE
jgi:hypothetical protein